jgi:hypothetical protein
MSHDDETKPAVIARPAPPAARASHPRKLCLHRAVLADQQPTRTCCPRA